MNKIYFEAVAAYERVCKNGTPVLCNDGEYHMLAYRQPSQTDSVVGRKYVHLNNCNGFIAKYVIKTGRIIA